MMYLNPCQTSLSPEPMTLSLSFPLKIYFVKESHLDW